MNNFEDKIKHEGSKVRLLQSEKEVLRNRILATEVGELPRRTLHDYMWSLRSVKFATVAFAAILIIGSPITYVAAQQSLPGDILHGFEIYVIERIEEVAQFSPDARIAYSASRLEERLMEMQQIPKIELTAAHITETSTNVQRHAEKVLKATVENEVDESEAPDLEQLVEVSALMGAHENALLKASARSEAIEDLNDAIAAELDDQVEQYAHGQSDENLIANIRQEIFELGVLVEGSSSTTTSDIENHLEEINEDIQSGDLEEALQATIDAKVEALAQDYGEKAGEE